MKREKNSTDLAYEIASVLAWLFAAAFFLPIFYSVALVIINRIF